LKSSSYRAVIWKTISKSIIRMFPIASRAGSAKFIEMLLYIRYNSSRFSVLMSHAIIGFATKIV